MNRDQTTALALIGLFIWLAWRREETGVNLLQRCCMPDGTVVMVPLGEPCPVGGVLCEDVPGWTGDAGGATTVAGGSDYPGDLLPN